MTREWAAEARFHAFGSAGSWNRIGPTRHRLEEAVADLTEFMGSIHDPLDQHWGFRVRNTKTDEIIPAEALG